MDLRLAAKTTPADPGSWVLYRLRINEQGQTAPTCAQPIPDYWDWEYIDDSSGGKNAVIVLLEHVHDHLSQPTPSLLST
jgi:hypothetical protein